MSSKTLKKKEKEFLISWRKFRIMALKPVGGKYEGVWVITPLKNKHKLINLHTAPLDV